MGIYPEISTTKPMFNMDTRLTTWIETRSYPGYKESRTVTATEWEESERTDCFCCSCDSRFYGSVDPYCRNHNYGFGQRPCEYHKLPGQTIENPETGEDTGVMPDSVQVERKRQYDEISDE